MAFNWNCPYCNTFQTVTENRQSVSRNSCGLPEQVEGHLVMQRSSIGCSNPDCLRTTIHVAIGAGRYRSDICEYVISDMSELVFSQFLLPNGSAKPQPDYVPLAARDDYYEACSIRDLSPKASATLTRRCLQGLIRDFANISKATLFEEINALREAVQNGTADRSITPESVEAIDHVRGIGNIGAHMEKDINLIVPVDPGEAQALIELVEMLFDEWYGARHRRQLRLARIESIAGEKKALKSSRSEIVAIADGRATDEQSGAIAT